MVTQRKTELAKASGDVRRAFGRFMRALPMVARVNWRNVAMPWRMIPAPVALALIALVALAMVLDNGDAPASADAGGDVIIGGDVVAPGTRCAEDEVISYLVPLGREGVGCIHYEYIVMDFIDSCLIGNSRYGDNLASMHLRDQAFGSWCASVVDDVSDGVVSLDDLLFDTARDGCQVAALDVREQLTELITSPVTPGYADGTREFLALQIDALAVCQVLTSEVSSTVSTPTVSATAMATPTATPKLPASLPNTGSR